MTVGLVTAVEASPPTIIIEVKTRIPLSDGPSIRDRAEPVAMWQCRSPSSCKSGAPSWLIQWSKFVLVRKTRLLLHCSPKSKIASKGKLGLTRMYRKLMDNIIII